MPVLLPISLKPYVTWFCFHVPALWELFDGWCPACGEYIILALALPSTHHKVIIQIHSLKFSPLLPIFKYFPFSSKIDKMISAKKLLKLAKKWQKMAAIRRKPIILPQTTDESSCSTSTKPEKGCSVVYSADKKCFLLPLEYLQNEMVRELFDMAEEEFGTPSQGPLTLPCESELMEFAISLSNSQLTEMSNGHC